MSSLRDETRYPNPGSRLLQVGSETDPSADQIEQIGDTVHRPHHENAGLVADLLVFLEHAGFTASPRYLGIDAQGRFIVTFIPGGTTAHPSERDERCYAEMGRLLRQLHDLTAGSDLAAGEECVLHGDPGPFNVVMRDGMPIAFIDWDRARPGERLTDVALAAWWWCIHRMGNVRLEDQARRLREFRDAYDPGIAGDDLLQAVIAAQRRIASAAEERFLAAVWPEDNLPHLQTIGWATIAREHVERNYEVLLTALA